MICHVSFIKLKQKTKLMHFQSNHDAESQIVRLCKHKNTSKRISKQQLKMIVYGMPESVVKI